jgi:hypothetical protein
MTTLNTRYYSIAPELKLISNRISKTLITLQCTNKHNSLVNYPENISIYDVKNEEYTPKINEMYVLVNGLDYHVLIDKKLVFKINASFASD